MRFGARIMRARKQGSCRDWNHSQPEGGPARERPPRPGSARGPDKEEEKGEAASGGPAEGHTDGARGSGPPPADSRMRERKGGGRTTRGAPPQSPEPAPPRRPPLRMGVGQVGIEESGGEV